MFQTTKQKVVSTKNFVKKHRVSIAVLSTAVVCTWGTRKALKQHDEFLKEHGLYEEFYTSSDDE